ncbi:tetratricopeptide repeat protein [Pelatocladus sp. BLCC-F211]|uniref:tetratricopeptide repeat protein n=1 Tax=Pelatocladus sp. BLCC-F211 TaxID=3342752 RepID=UPI0035B86D4C
MPLTFSFALSQNQTFELRCDYGSRRLDSDELLALIDICEKNYYLRQKDSPPELIQLGRRLYHWLDGKEGWLRRALDEADEGTIYLDLIQTTEAQGLNPQTERMALGLAHLPWELLHDRTGFLLTRQDIAVLPVRSMQQRNTQVIGVQNRPLRLLFMATAPEDPRVATLEFEREEANILQATKDQPLALIVEESGSVEELKNLVASYDEDYFDVFHITGHGLIYTNQNYSFLLRQGQRIADHTPCLITEDEVGNVQLTTVNDLAKAFRGRWPRVIFLSGCHTGEVANKGTVPSMAQQLVKAGAGVVLGWARPVYDRTGIIAAKALYQALATGATVEEAVKAAQQEMIAEECTDWHLLRIYRDTRPIEQLVTPLRTRGREKLVFTPPENEFLDENNIVKVASSLEFVGRRRALQRCLRALRETSDNIGVFIAGMGGLGKSSLAARLCTRVRTQREDFQQVVLIGVLDEIGLLNKLSSKYERFADVPALLNEPKVSLKGRLQNFFEAIENEHNQPLLLVLDDFEQNIPTANIENSSLRMTAEAYRILEAICAALAENNAVSRLIVTSRYLKADTLPPHRLHLEFLAAMSKSDIDKICRPLDKEVKQQPITQRIIKVADGNPRLLKWLLEIIQQPSLESDALLTRLEATEQKFRENILAQTLLDALEVEEKKLLARLSVFQLPVTEEIIFDLFPTPPLQGKGLETSSLLGREEGQRDLSSTPELGDGELLTPLTEVGQRGIKSYLAKLTSLSLVESATTHPTQTPTYRVTTILESLLQPVLTPEEWQTTRKAATQSIYKNWWKDAENHYEEQAHEIVRLAVLAEERELAVTVGDNMATNWINSSRYVEAWEICQEILQLGEDYRILGTIARAEFVLGRIENAFTYYQQALNFCPKNDLKEKSEILNNLGRVFAQQGNTNKALSIWQSSLELSESINYFAGIAGTSHNMAQVFALQGDINQALLFYKRSLQLYENINCIDGIAGTLHEIAKIVAQQSKIQQALSMWNRSLKLYESINNIRGVAFTLHEMAGVIAQQGDVNQALSLWERSLELKENINDVFGSAVTLANIAYCAGEQGDKTRQLNLYLQAVEKLAKVRAYVNLAQILGNLGTIADSKGLTYFAQAIWLTLRIQAPLADTISLIRALYNVVPQGDEIQALLGATAMFFCNYRGEGHPQLEELRDISVNMVVGAAGRQGIETEEAFATWWTQQRLNDPEYFLPRLNQRLEEIVGDGWLFDQLSVKRNGEEIFIR